LSARVMAIMPLPVPKSSNLHDLSLNKATNSAGVRQRWLR
jgi:hypothetical protein